MPPSIAPLHPHAEHMARLYDRCPMMVSLYDPADMLRWANPAFYSAHGLAPGTLLTWSDLMRHNHWHQVGAVLTAPDIEAWLVSTRSRRGKLPYRSFEADLRDGRWICMTETMDEQGWMLCIGFDISELRAGERSLRQARDGALRAAQVDALTGISNRAHVLQQLDTRLDQLRQHGQPCGLVLLDLDHFKRINDTHGHMGGDLVLTAFARLVEATLRRDDGFGRLGGEEFMLLLPNVTPQTLALAVDRVLSKVAAAQPLPDVPGFRFTCSAGAAMLDPALDAVHNMRQVDMALYAAKARGRNQWVWADEAA